MRSRAQCLALRRPLVAAYRRVAIAEKVARSLNGAGRRKCYTGRLLHGACLLLSSGREEPRPEAPPERGTGSDAGRRHRGGKKEALECVLVTARLPWRCTSTPLSVAASAALFAFPRFLSFPSPFCYGHPLRWQSRLAVASSAAHSNCVCFSAVAVSCRQTTGRTPGRFFCAIREEQASHRASVERWPRAL